MNKQQLFEQIEAYLAGKLPVEERKALEQQMADDPELVAEVNLHRQLEKSLSDKPKLEFRQKLVGLAAEFPATTRKPAFRRWWWAPLLALLIIPLLWWWSVRPEKNMPPPEDFLKTNEPTDTLADVEFPPSSRPLVDSVQIDPTPPIPLRNNPGNSVYAPNPEMEKWLLQPPDDYLAIDTAILENFPVAGAGAYDVRFYGRMLTALDAPKLELSLSDNRLPIGKEVIRLPVTARLIPDNENIFAFAAKKTYNLEASRTAKLANGLYYCRLLPAGGSKPIWTGRLVIGK